jgi:anti-sigma28 factor (negative regulator of flagellin synthesis)
MVGIQGLGGVPEPKPDRPAKIRSERESAALSSGSKSGTAAKDGVEISSEAQAAAEVGRVVAAAGTEGDIRADRVAAAKAAIERGDYKNPEVVAKVANKVSKYLP